MEFPIIDPHDLMHNLMMDYSPPPWGEADTMYDSSIVYRIYLATLLMGAFCFVFGWPTVAVLMMMGVL